MCIRDSINAEYGGAEPDDMALGCLQDLVDAAIENERQEGCPAQKRRRTTKEQVGTKPVFEKGLHFLGAYPSAGLNALPVCPVNPSPSFGSPTTVPASHGHLLGDFSGPGPYSVPLQCGKIQNNAPVLNPYPEADAAWPTRQPLSNRPWMVSQVEAPSISLASGVLGWGYDAWSQPDHAFEDHMIGRGDLRTPSSQMSNPMEQGSMLAGLSGSSLWQPSWLHHSKPVQRAMAVKPPSSELDSEPKSVATAHIYHPEQATAGNGEAQRYTCGYCGYHKTSSSAAGDGMVRIRCPCGGARADGVSRMHAHWKRMKPQSAVTESTEAVANPSVQLEVGFKS
eukprot:TRINITY_DN13620_c0_g2_i9.p1 TRINITY_DN13620_c0_g2~~TRINITY_DN13620_c0_g2_i9.p1  ORF type:complete len:347 (+),score=40.16 TRINITY_DN13620_c0_g2_i9:28-1041(+)